MTIPAGWYDDGSGAKRWWDGSEWTLHVSSSPTAAPDHPSPHLPPPAEAAPAAPLTSGEAAPAAAFIPPYTPPSVADHVGSAAYGVPPTPSSAGPTSHPYGAAFPVTAAATPPTSPGRIPALGIAGLATAFVGAIGACIPAVSLVGWAVLVVGLVLSVVSLFLRSRKWAGISGIGVAVFGALAAGAIGLLFSVAGDVTPIADRGSSTDDTSTGSENTDPEETDVEETGPVADGEPIQVMDLEIGDCLPYIDDTVYELTLLPCDQPHDSEVYSIFSFPEDGEYPGDDAVTAEAISKCEAAFDEFVGAPYSEVYDLDYYWFAPTKRSWDNADDRAVQCLIFSYDGDVTGTLKGSAATVS